MTEHELRALGDCLEYPDERDLGPAVRARLRGRPVRTRALVVVLAAALLAVALAFAVPPARGAILRFLHLQGVTIEYVDRLPPAKPQSPLDIGIPIRPADIEATAGFRPLTSPLLGRPDEVTWDGGMIWYRYGDIRVLVSQFRATGVERFIKKVVSSGTTVTPLAVDGAMGFFLTGAQHFLYLAPNDVIRDERVRLAKDVLLWQHGPLTIRLEGRFTLAQALRIARSFS
jgi:hypothetical protein